MEDVFLSKSGATVMPERLSREKDYSGQLKLHLRTELEKRIDERLKMRFKGEGDMNREILKLVIGFNRDFMRELDRPNNEVESSVN